MEDSYDFVPPTSVLAPAILAVATVNLVILAYVVRAAREELAEARGEAEARGKAE